MKKILSQSECTKPSHTPDVRSLRQASSSEPQQVVFNPSPFVSFSTPACCTSFVFDPGTVSGHISAPCRPERHAHSRRVMTPWPQTTDCNWHSLSLNDTLSPEAFMTQGSCQTDTYPQACPDSVGGPLFHVLQFTTPRHPWHGASFRFTEVFSRKLAVFNRIFLGTVVFSESWTFLFLTSIFASLPIDLSTPGRQDQSESLSKATLWPRQMSARKHLAAPSSPS